VRLADIREAIIKAGPDELVLGIGKRGRAVTVDLHADSPHLALSVGSGGGKTRTARLIGAQVAYKGGLVVIVNLKRIGYSWTRGLPNCAQAKTPEQAAELLLWLDFIRKRREELADLHADDEDEIGVDIGPRILLIFEEANLTVGPLRDVSPEATAAYADLFYAGRQVKINVVAIAQRLSVRTTAGADARESVGCRIMGRYTPQSWKMLCSEHKMPEPNDLPGRLQVVTSEVHELQAANLSGAEARQLATRWDGHPVPARDALQVRP
jgi:hypothetical protein